MEKEIENMLNKVCYEIEKHINNGYAVDMLVPLEFDVTQWQLFKNYIDNLETQLKKQKEINKKAIEYIKNNSHYFSTDSHEIFFCIEEEKEEVFCKEILSILEDKEV